MDLIFELKSLVEAGIPVFYIKGNHDFFSFSNFEKLTGVTVLDFCELKIGGRSIYVEHGHGDMADKPIFRLMRSGFIQEIYANLLPASFAVWLASSVAALSRLKKRCLRGTRLVERYSAFTNYDIIVYGHIHTHSICENGSSLLINCGTWLDKLHPVVSISESSASIFMINASGQLQLIERKTFF